jgi:hypothetical protein
MVMQDVGEVQMGPEQLYQLNQPERRVMAAQSYSHQNSDITNCSQESI